MPGPASKIGSLTAHGGTVIGPGCPTVLVEKTPAIRIGSDMHVCPMVTPGAPPIPHIGMNNIGPGVPTVLIGGFPASTVGDNFLCAGPPAPVLTGASTIFIGTGSTSSKSVNRCNSPLVKIESELKAGTIFPVKGTENYPVEIQTIALIMQKYCKSKGKQVDMSTIETMAREYERKKKEDAKYKELTIADFVEILKKVEQENGYQFARQFAGHLNYDILCRITRAYVNGQNTNPQNDPNQMPTRYMLLFGADDTKLHAIDDHPDKTANEEHKITVANLRKALVLQGFSIQDSGLYDDSVFDAYRCYFFQFLKGIRKGLTHKVICGEDLGKIARMYLLPSWKYLYECNKSLIGDNPDLLKEGTVLNIPQYDFHSADQLIAEKGANVEKYVGGLIWRYPWQSKSISFIDDIKTGQLFDFKGDRDFKIIAVENGIIISSGTIKKADDIDVLIPDMVKTRVLVDGLIIRK